MVKSHGLAVGALLAWALCAAQPAMAQDPVDGVCQDDVRNTCTAGTPNDDAVPDSSSAYLWRCDGLNGGHLYSRRRIRRHLQRQPRCLHRLREQLSDDRFMRCRLAEFADGDGLYASRVFR